MRFGAALLVCSAVLVAGETHIALRKAIAKRLLEADITATGTTDEAIHLPELVSAMYHGRRELRLGDDIDPKCDAALMECLADDVCVNCFMELDQKDIDWASVTKSTTCDSVIKFLNDNGHCKDLTRRKDSSKEFCDAYNTCVVYDENNEDDDDGLEIDCSALTECKWPGMYESFIGDGVCHDRMPGCYNTAICGYDGGDCCKDTCSTKGIYNSCGSDGYACKDPKSKNCDPNYTGNCDSSIIPPDDNNVNPAAVDCGPNQALYRLVMYDSFGDGWDETKITITSNAEKSVVYEGGLKDGYQGTRYICLSTTPATYTVKVTGGIWGAESSWEVRGYSEGSPVIASGGAPMNCQFGVAGSKEKNTCDGDSNVKPNDDPDYKEFKDLYKCINEKCPIQVGQCRADPTCATCFVDDTADYCYGIDIFNAVVDCTLCKCTDNKDSTYCTGKLTPGAVVPDRNHNAHNNAKKPCSPTETVQGSNAVMAFGKCTDFDEISMMVTEFDQNHFGTLDTFENCAHSYAARQDHGGFTALGCMQILLNAKNGKVDDAGSEDKAIKDAISALAGNLYDDAESFCGCAKNASDTCPLCPSFLNFKTLLYESLDACQALDEIDCAAWQEFAGPCKRNMQDKFGKIDFSKRNQCDFIGDSCGGAGPFPAFRRLDCGAEIPNEDWDFYGQYATKCLKDAPKPNPGPAPAPRPTPKPYVPPDSPTAPAPKPSPVSPTDDNSKPSDGKKPYIPPEERGKKNKKKKESSSTDSNKSSSSHWFRNFLLIGVIGGAGYYMYKRRSDEFSFVRYRRMNRPYGGDQDMYTGLSMESSTTFEPPTLPPRPDATGADYYS